MNIYEEEQESFEKRHVEDIHTELDEYGDIRTIHLEDEYCIAENKRDKALKRQADENDRLRAELAALKGANTDA
jgi:hypothetical protein